MATGAMDLYTNKLGREIARENPYASEEELAQAIDEALRVNKDDTPLGWSDEVKIGDTGKVPATAPELPGKVQEKDGDSAS